MTMLCESATAQEWNRSLRTTAGEEIVALLQGYAAKFPRLAPATRGLKRAVRTSLSQLGLRVRGIDLVSVSKVEAALLALRATQPTVFWERLDQDTWYHSRYLLKVPLWHVGRRNVFVGASRDATRDQEDWIANELRRALGENEWSAFRNCIREDLAWSRYVRRRASECFLETLQHVVAGLAAARRPDDDSYQEEAQRRHALARPFLAMFEAGHFPLGLCWDEDYHARRFLLLVA